MSSFFMKKLLILFALVLILTANTYAKDTTQRVGDFFAILLPAVAYSSTFYLDDKDGRYQFYKSYSTTLISTYMLKYTVKEKRPDSDNKDSFPSAHSASAFSSASFIHKRYTLKYALLPYLTAVFTAYSRVEADRHYNHDVIVGGVIGVLSSYYFATRYKNIELKPIVSKDYKGLQLNYSF